MQWPVSPWHGADRVKKWKAKKKRSNESSKSTNYKLYIGVIHKRQPQGGGSGQLWTWRGVLSWKWMSVGYSHDTNDRNIYYFAQYVHCKYRHHHRRRRHLFCSHKWDKSWEQKSLGFLCFYILICIWNWCFYLLNECVLVVHNGRYIDIISIQA